MPLKISKLVLLVEDEEDDILLFERACLRAEVTFARRSVRDGRQAIDYLEGNGRYRNRVVYPMPDMVILDVNMPVLSGFDVLRWIRASQDASNLIVVMFTSSKADADVKRAYELLANSYLVKPLTSDDLVVTLSVIERYWITLNLVPGMPPHAIDPSSGEGQVLA